MTDYIQKVWAETGPATMTVAIPDGVWSVDRIHLAAASGWTGGQSATIKRLHARTYLLDETLETVALSGTSHSWVPTADSDWLESPALIGQAMGNGDALEIKVSCGATDAYLVEAILKRIGGHRAKVYTREAAP